MKIATLTPKTCACGLALNKGPWQHLADLHEERARLQAIIGQILLIVPSELLPEDLVLKMMEAENPRTKS